MAYKKRAWEADFLLLPSHHEPSEHNFFGIGQDKLLLTIAVLGHNLCGQCQKEVLVISRAEIHMDRHLLGKEWLNVEKK